MPGELAGGARDLFGVRPELRSGEVPRVPALRRAFQQPRAGAVLLSKLSRHARATAEPHIRLQRLAQNVGLDAARRRNSPGQSGTEQCVPPRPQLNKAFSVRSVPHSDLKGIEEDHDRGADGPDD